MGWQSTGAHKATVERRRELVAAARLRGLTLREIPNALASAAVPCVNSDGQPWGYVTIRRDIQAAEEEWRRRYSAEIAEHKARVLAEIGLVKRHAWQAKDLPIVLKALTQEAALLGLDAPVKVAPTDPSGEHEYGADDVAAVRARLLGLIAAAGGAEGDGGAGADADAGRGAGAAV